MKRTLILFALLITLAPALLFAQDDVTLEGLNNRLQALSTDLVILAKELRRLNERVTALEAPPAVAPTAATATCDLTPNLPVDPVQLNEETRAAHRTQYGREPPLFMGIIKVVMHRDGRVQIYYASGRRGNYRSVSELWDGCDYAGHTPWKELEDINDFR
ncbi:MAG: hypothetical protein OXH93_16445 [Caldilineaceae bacterium]|nr:hypothetical protein [Caldilineaceae bacterium]